MMNSSQSLRDDALAIWKAGVSAVDSEWLVQQNFYIEGEDLHIAGEIFSLSEINRLIVVGAGKAGAGMAAAVEKQLGPKLCQEKLSGWVNVPADCVRPLSSIQLHPARPAGVNEPTEEGVYGSEQIIQLLNGATDQDVVVVLLSGGGSALLPAPAPGISLNDKQEVTRFLAQAGAPIQDLNLVRRQLSALKGGGLARGAAGAKRIISLIISDVIGDPLDVIASGPTVELNETPHAALEKLKELSTLDRKPSAKIIQWLETQVADQTVRQDPFPKQVVNCVLGSNAVALSAAQKEAINRGYEVHSEGSEQEGEAAKVGVRLANQLVSIRESTEYTKPVCLLSGGEPIVKLAESDQPRKGGRNQELVLAALEAWWDENLEQLVLLSGGTDGEDGPTNAAGGFVDEEVRQLARQKNILISEFLANNNSYPALESLSALLITGPTHTNVMDLRVGLVGCKK